MWGEGELQVRVVCVHLVLAINQKWPLQPSALQATMFARASLSSQHPFGTSTESKVCLPGSSIGSTGCLCWPGLEHSHTLPRTLRFLLHQTEPGSWPVICGKGLLGCVCLWAVVLLWAMIGEKAAVPWVSFFYNCGGEIHPWHKPIEVNAGNPRYYFGPMCSSSW